MRTWLNHPMAWYTGDAGFAARRSGNSNSRSCVRLYLSDEMNGGEVDSLPDDPGKDGGCEMSGQGGCPPRCERSTAWRSLQAQPRGSQNVKSIPMNRRQTLMWTVCGQSIPFVLQQYIGNLNRSTRSHTETRHVARGLRACMHSTWSREERRSRACHRLSGL